MNPQRKPFSLSGKFILAPMAGITDVAFRMQCKKYGAALTITELTSVEGIVRRKDELEVLLDVIPGEKPSIQLFGNNKESIVAAAKIVAPLACAIDFNIGCPAPHITAQEAGAALLMKPEHLKQIISSLVAAVDVPVTAKLRAGPNEHTLVYKEIALTLQEAGVSMITLHPRTVKQGYSGKAVWKRIKDLVAVLSIPVCGNGDVTTPELAKQMLEETGCSYVMIGRGAAGNPFIFQQCNSFLQTGTYSIPTREERIGAFIEYSELAAEHKVDFTRVKGMAMQYTRGLDGAKSIRLKISSAQTMRELQEAFTSSSE
jgi:nifR3 family TIM-barrel protein